MKTAESKIVGWFNEKTGDFKKDWDTLPHPDWKAVSYTYDASQFNADGRGEENDGFVWICPGDGYWSINGHISFITGGKEFGFNKGPTIFRVTHESSPLKPISESRGETGDEMKEKVICVLEKRMNDTFSNGSYRHEQGRLAEAIAAIVELIPPDYFSSLRSSEPEIAPTEKDLAVLRTILFQRTKQISEDLDSKKVSMYDHKGNKLYPATIIDEEMLRMANEIIDLVLKNSPTYEPMSEPEREGKCCNEPKILTSPDNTHWCQSCRKQVASPPLKPLSEELTDDEIKNMVSLCVLPMAARGYKLGIEEGMKLYRSELKRRLNPIPSVKEKGEEK